MSNINSKFQNHLKCNIDATIISDQHLFFLSLANSFVKNQLLLSKAEIIAMLEAISRINHMSMHDINYHILSLIDYEEVVDNIICITSNNLIQVVKNKIKNMI